MEKTRVLLVEDDAFTRNTLAGTLTNEGLDVVACGKVSEAIEIFTGSNFDVLVADLDLGNGPTGSDLAGLLRKQKADLGVVILTSFQDPRLHRQNISLPRSSEYLVKQDISNIAQILDAIASAKAKAEDLGSKSAGPTPLDLTDVQLETMRLVAEGLTNAEIAKRRFVSDKAIEKTLRSIVESLRLPIDSATNQRVQITKAYLRLTGGKV